MAAVLGGILGFERERVGKAAGLRTHMLVTVGSCLFTLVPLEAGVGKDAMARVVQGLAAGIGFLGAGSILKLTEERKIHGLTTAANIWVAAAPQWSGRKVTGFAKDDGQEIAEVGLIYCQRTINTTKGREA